MTDISRLSIATNNLDQQKKHDELVMTLNPTSNRPGSRDITSEFTVAASALTTGQLIKDEYFTLFEAVGALEIMDPKMDSGYLTTGEAVEDDYDVLRELLPEEVIGIMDQLLCFEMAWHTGCPLSQCLFTSLYIDRLLWPEPKSLEQARFDRDKIPGPEKQLLHLVLRAYCLGLIKTCDLVRERIIGEDYYEEEDFVGNLYHRTLLRDFERDDVDMILVDAIAYVNKDINIANKNIKYALHDRLSLRRALLSAVDLVQNRDRQRVNGWERCLELLPSVSQTAGLGLPSENSFSIKIQQKLASSVPPRSIVNISIDDAVAHLSRICQDGRDAYRILDYHGGSNLLTFVLTYHTRTPHPLVYIRCLLQSLLLGEMKVLGTVSFKQLVLDELEETVLPGDVLVDPANGDIEAPQDPRFQIAKIMDGFVAKVAVPFLDISRRLCMNRSRLRRMLCRDIVEWENLQLDAEGTDTELRRYTQEKPVRDSNSPNEEIWSFPLSSWAYYQKIRQMEWIVQMGFELDIYHVDELAGMYWYLQHLASTRLQHIERIRTFTTRRLASITKPTFKQKNAFRRSLSFLEFAALEASATQSFADGLSCLFSFLIHLCRVPSPYRALEFNTPEYRYALRMRPFLAVSLPEVPSYSEFASLLSLRTLDQGKGDDPEKTAAKNIENNEQAASILDVADLALKEARKSWEAISKANTEQARCIGCEDWWRTSMRNVMRSCITANIMVATSKKAISQAGSSDAGDMLKIEMIQAEKRYHPWWIVPQISTK